MTRTTDSRPHMAAIYASGTVKATCAATVRPRAGRPAPTSPTFIPSQAAPCRVLCGGSLRRRNNRDQHRAQAVPSWARWSKNPGAAVAAPGVQS